ncbi:hypothetical protein BDW74DRAFT_156897 [Aspergillus multicolor]|uniref:uncharacterized protein n=1 Tax=Aspergillus multicolor TaxID=41759 RepID=UPI003CCCCBB3
MKKSSHHLLRNLELVFTLDPTDKDRTYWGRSELGWARVTSSNTLLRRSLYLRTYDSAIRKEFGHFPYQRTNVIAKIYAPDPHDPGQLMVLWRRVNNLVDLLGQASSIQKIKIKLRSKKQYTWAKRNAKDRTSVEFARWPLAFCNDKPFPYSLNFSIARNPYDHEVVFLPFCRLKNIEAMRIDVRWKGARDPLSKMDWSLHTFAMRHIAQTLANGSAKSVKSMVIESSASFPVSLANLITDTCIRRVSCVVIPRDETFKIAPDSANA